MKEMVHPKMKILSLITRPHVVPNPQDLHSYSEHKLRYVWWNPRALWPPLQKNHMNFTFSTCDHMCPYIFHMWSRPYIFFHMWSRVHIFSTCDHMKTTCHHILQHKSTCGTCGSHVENVSMCYNRFSHVDHVWNFFHVTNTVHFQLHTVCWLLVCSYFLLPIVVPCSFLSLLECTVVAKLLRLYKLVSKIKVK